MRLGFQQQTCNERQLREGVNVVEGESETKIRKEEGGGHCSSTKFFHWLKVKPKTLSDQTKVMKQEHQMAI